MITYIKNIVIKEISFIIFSVVFIAISYLLFELYL